MGSDRPPLLLSARGCSGVRPPRAAHKDQTTFPRQLMRTQVPILESRFFSSQRPILEPSELLLHFSSAISSAASALKQRPAFVYRHQAERWQRLYYSITSCEVEYSTFLSSISICVSRISDIEVMWSSTSPIQPLAVPVAVAAVHSVAAGFTTVSFSL